MFKPKQPKTLREAVLRTVGRNVACLLLAVGAFLGAQALAPISATMVAPNHGDVMDNRPHAAGSPVGLIEKHDCWTGEAPADMQGVVPGHVVVTPKGGEPTYAGSKMVGKALSQIFEDKDFGLEVHGFCR